MTEIRIKVGSVTNAQRAKRILAELGYRTQIKRSISIGRNEGCGYSVVLFGAEEEKNRAVKAIKKAGIRIISVET